MEQNRPKVGVGVFILKDNKILFGKRKNAHGDGTWSLPGGHLEFGESVEECARREVMEETGLKIKNLRSGPYTNDIFEIEQKHYITLFVISNYDGGEPQLFEPDKCEKWDWFELNDIPKELFLPIKNLLKTNFNPFKY